MKKSERRMGEEVKKMRRLVRDVSIMVTDLDRRQIALKNLEVLQCQSSDSLATLTCCPLPDFVHEDR